LEIQTVSINSTSPKGSDRKWTIGQPVATTVSINSTSPKGSDTELKLIYYLEYSFH